jgi:hypothetical protein
MDSEELTTRFNRGRSGPHVTIGEPIKLRGFALPADGTTALGSLTKENAPHVNHIVYAYSDRRNGWYCYAADAVGNQIGAAAYEYRKADIVWLAHETAKVFGVEVRRA